MKITKTQLKQIIKEELAGVLDEADAPEEEEAEGPEIKSAGRGTSKEDHTSVGRPVVKNTPEDDSFAKAVTKDKKEKENKKK